MCMIKHYTLCLVFLIFVLVFLMFLDYVVRYENTIIRDLEKSQEFTGYFLTSLRLMRKFSEKNAELVVSRFNFSRNLFYLEQEKIRWDTDCDLFVQTCLTCLNILDFYNDRESVFYHNPDTAKMLLFTDRMLRNRLRNDQKDFFNNDKLHHIYASLAASMYVYRDLLQKDKYVAAVQDYEDLMLYMDFYWKRFNGKVWPKTECKIFKQYENYIDACEHFNRRIENFL